MTKHKSDRIREKVRERYAGIATSGRSGCGCTPSCCSPKAPSAKAQSAKLGYSKQDLDAVPEESNMGLGCGNPQAIAMLKKGEVVLDLGAGGGFDCFLAARQVGPRGRVIGVDKHSGCVAGALQVRKLERVLKAAGFRGGCVKVKEASKEFIKDWFPGTGVERYVRSADVRGTKPGKASAR